MELTGTKTDVDLMHPETGRRVRKITLTVPNALPNGARPVEWTLPAPADLSPKVGVVDLIPAGGENYKAKLRIRARFVPLTEDLGKRMGWGLSYASLRRLINAGFVQGGKVQPTNWVVSIASVEEHLRACMEDPDFWTEERTKHYIENKDY